MNIGNHIRKIRTLKGVSQYYVAHVLGISQRQLSRIENNNSDVKFSVLHKICTVLEVSMDELLNFNDSTLFHSSKKTPKKSNEPLSQKLIKQYESRILHLEQEVAFLRKLLRKKR
jgi:transcriptional regulator with XRE-family HTH domain